MRLDRLNTEPDDNYRVYYRDQDTGKLYCWLCYGPVAAWSFYVCTRDGEPSHVVSAPAGMVRPGAAA